MTKKEITDSEEFQKALLNCRRNLVGDYAYQCLFLTMQSIESRFGKVGVGLLAQAEPRIKRVVKVPPEYIEMAEKAA